MGKRSATAHTLLLGLFKKPIASVKDIQNITGLSPKAAGDLTAIFEKAGILTEITKQQRNRVFAFKDYLDLFADKK